MALTPELEIRATIARRRWLRFASIVLIVNGILGLASLAVAFTYVSGPLGESETIDASIDDSRAELVETLQQTGVTLGGAEDAFDGLDQSLVEAAESSASAATVARGISDTMYGLAQAMNVNIFGATPLAGLAPSFQLAGQQLSDLAANLDSMTAALSRNSADITRTESDLAGLRDQLAELTTAVQETEIPNRVGAVTQVLRIALYALMAWLAVFAASSLLVGVAIWRGLHPR